MLRQLTIRKGISLLRKSLSFFFWIIGFRHYFVDFESFQKWQQHAFLLFFSIKKRNHTNSGLPAIYIIFIFSKKSYQFQQKTFLWDLKLVLFWSFRFICQRYTYEVVPTYWLTLTLDPSLFPWEIAQYFFTRAPSCTISITPQQKMQCGFEWNRAKDVESRASFIIEWWI